MIAVMVSTLTSSGRYLHLVLFLFTLTKTTVPSTSSEETTTTSSTTSVPTSTTVETTKGNTRASTTEATTTFTTTPLTPTEITTIPSTGSEATTTASSTTSVPTFTTIETTKGSTNASTTEATTTFTTTPLTPTDRDLVIAPHPEVMEINKTYQLHCTGPRVYPITKLHLKWLRGNKVVKSVNSTHSGKPTQHVTPLVNILDLIASKTDDGQVYTCLAELDLDTNTTKEIKSSSVTLQTYSFPEPRILNRKPIVVNEEVTLECEVHNVYPAENLTVTWFHNDEELKLVTKTSASHDIWATTWTPQDTGLAELTCRADFEDYPLNLTRSDNISIEVYVFSKPVIQALLPIVEGKLVNITCSVFNVSGKLQLALKNGNTILANDSSSTELTIYHTLHPKMELNGQQLTCEAELTLQHHSETIVKQCNTTLNVQSEESTRNITIITIVMVLIFMAIAIIYTVSRLTELGNQENIID